MKFEEPLLAVVMKYVRQNQSEAARILGLSRGTLRAKLKKIRHAVKTKLRISHAK